MHLAGCALYIAGKVCDRLMLFVYDPRPIGEDTRGPGIAHAKAVIVIHAPAVAEIEIPETDSLDGGCLDECGRWLQIGTF
jgi:hypothetical protein